MQAGQWTLQMEARHFGGHSGGETQAPREDVEAVGAKQEYVSPPK